MEKKMEKKNNFIPTLGGTCFINPAHVATISISRDCLIIERKEQMVYQIMCRTHTHNSSEHENYDDYALSEQYKSLDEAKAKLAEIMQSF